MSQESNAVGKLPQVLLPSLLAWRPSQTPSSSTTYLIVENGGNILIDPPAWTTEFQDFLAQYSSIRHILITHRDAVTNALKPLQQKYHAQIWLQEQAAYLIPEVELTTFTETAAIAADIKAIWTPGYSPDSTCFYRPSAGILFTGRHLLLDRQGNLQLLRRAKTFHWFRQLKSVAKLRDRFTPETLKAVCPGIHPLGETAWLSRPQVYAQLTALDLVALRRQVALL